ncbi:unnamed protein product [Adineta steineri]|uniref:Dynamin N-terminal domain-containing protein n=1 Tax=Adineta steineri TaxID=433720 RepID=A0A819QV13_9BILA|nr:unnamed protein product [Adineta steineri]CAF4034556.1 unnamed protein product [Adineta steineri]
MDIDVPTLQTELIRFLEDYDELLRDSDKILYRTFTYPDTIQITTDIDLQETLNEIQRKIQDVQVLQIRMPIIAPMKAGKSTIINAHIGGEYLPTRSDAMTAVPTAVALKLGEPDNGNIWLPKLILENQTKNAIETLQSTVTEILRNHFKDDDQSLETLLHSNDHLTTTAKFLRDNPTNFSNTNDHSDEHLSIQKRLTFINELIRISIYLSSYQSDSNMSLNSFLNNIPSIHVNYQPIPNAELNIRYPCQLLFIDTPGPNEAAGVTQLTRFLKNELRKADVILVVVEYGHFNTEIDAKIIDEIKNISHIGYKEGCIYVLISKADQRQRKDMPIDKLRQHVAELYSVNIDHVFELSGKYALIAQNFLTDYRQHGNNIDTRTSNTVKDILEIYCPVDWSERLDDVELREVEMYASRLYNKSGLTKVLDKVLTTVLGEVISRCFKSAILTCQTLNANLKNDIDIRLNGLKQMAEGLRKEIDDLDQDLKALDNIKNIQLEAMKKISDRLENNLKSTFENTLNECNKQVMEIFNENNKKWYDKEKEQQRQNDVEKMEAGQVKVGFIAGGVAGVCVTQTMGGDAAIGLGAIGGSILSLVIVQKLIAYFRKDQNEVEFASEADATTFKNGITELVNNLSKSAYATAEKEVNSICSAACHNFESQISDQMKNILQRAKDRLNSTFNIQQIVLTKIDLKLNQINLDVNDIGRIEPYYPTFFHRLSPITLPKTRDSTWILSRSTIQEKCEEGVKANLKQIQTDIVEHTNKEMKDNFQSLFNDLQAYLLKYQRYAEICLSDKRLTEENQATFISDLEKLRQRVLEKETEVNSFNQSVDWTKLS